MNHRMECATRDCNNDEVASGMCYECMNKHPGITKTIIDESNSYVIDGARYFRGLGGSKIVEVGDIIREWN